MGKDRWGKAKYFRTDPEYAKQKANERKGWEKEWKQPVPSTFSELKNDIFCGIFAPGGIFGCKKVPGHVVKAPTSSSAFASTSFSSISKPLHPWGEEKELRVTDGSESFGKWYDKMVTVPTPVSLKVNGQQIVKIEQFRSVSLPDQIMLGESFHFQLACCNPNGRKIAASDPVYLKVSYNDLGQIIKMLVPNTPQLSNDPNLPVLTVHNGKVCTLPVSTGTYHWLTEKILENQGEVEIVGQEPYTFECLG